MAIPQPEDTVIPAEFIDRRSASRTRVYGHIDEGIWVGQTASDIFDTTVPTLILKVGRNPLHHGGVGIARSLGRVGVSVYGMYEDRFIPGSLSKFVQGRFVWDNGGIPADGFLSGMAAIAERIQRPTVLVPIDDHGAVLLAEHADSLRGSFLFPHQSSDMSRTLASKEGLYRICKELGVPSPEAVFPATKIDVEEFLAGAVFPVVVKATERWSLPSNTRVKSTTIVHSPQGLLDVYEQLGDRRGAGLMFQEYIPREQGRDWIFHGYCNERSDCVVGFTGVKVRSYPAYAGPTTFGVCVENEQLRHQAEALFKLLEYKGIMDLDYRLDLRDGLYKLTDFNPRIGAQFRLFVNSAGIDVVRALHLDLTGRDVPRAEPVEGRRFIAEHHDALAGWAYHRDGGLTLRAWLRSVRGVEERAWLATDDLRPFVVMSVRFLIRGIELALDRMSRRSKIRRKQRISIVRRDRVPRPVGRWRAPRDGR
jgi:D-aspartate ligase